MKKNRLISKLHMAKNLKDFLIFAEGNEINIKLWWTAMTDIMQNSKQSEVLKWIKELINGFEWNINIIVSAPWKYKENENKITKRLLHAKSLIESWNKKAWQEELVEIRNDFLDMANNNIPENYKKEIMQDIIIIFAELNWAINVLKKEWLNLHPWLILDMYARIWEETWSYLLSKILNAAHISTKNISVDTKNWDEDIWLSDIIDDFSVKLRSSIDYSKERVKIIPWYPWEMKWKWTISETWMWYSDYAAAMATKEWWFLILAKQSWAILQTNPKILKKWAGLSKIQIMPISQAVVMTDIIWDQIQVIHPMALQVAKKKKLNIMVIDEKSPFTWGTLIIPDEEFEEFINWNGNDKTDLKDNINELNLPMMWIANDAYTLQLQFNILSWNKRQDVATRKIYDFILEKWWKIVEKNFISHNHNNKSWLIIISWMKDEDIAEIKQIKLADVDEVTISEKHFIIWASWLKHKDTSNKLIKLFSWWELFHTDSIINWYAHSVWLLIPEIEDKHQREDLLTQAVWVVNWENL